MDITLFEGSLIARQHNRIIKRFIDILIGVPSLIVVSPLFLLIALLVRIDSPGNPIFSQVRIGRNGKNFTMYKIRTLYQQHFGLITEQEEPHLYRVTRMGKYLRKSKIDEVPQLINIILGDMSIVGPRPDLPLHLTNYTSFQHNRFFVKPGLTGIAQVSGNTLLSWPDRISLDIWYLKNWTVLMDIRIIGYTFSNIFKSKTDRTDPFNLYDQLSLKTTATSSDHS